MRLSKTWITIGLFCLLAAIPYFAPPLERFRVIEGRRIAASFAAWKPGAFDRVILKPRPTMAENFHPAEGSAPAASPANTPLAPSLLTGEYVGKN